MNHLGNYKTEEFPTSRIATIDIGAVSRTKHHIKALIELDVTEALRIISEKKKQRQNISFNSWLIKCIGKAVEEFREIHGDRVPLPYVIRKTNEKSISDICDEIKTGQNQTISDEGDYVLGEKKNEFLMKVYYSMPGFIRRMIWRRIVGSPFMTKENMGTVIVTSVGMMGKINGWVIPVSVHPVSFAVGSIIKNQG